MFENSKTKRPAIELSKLSSLIAEDIEIIGDLSFTNGIRIDGRVNGNIAVGSAEEGRGGLLVVSEKGHIEGSIRCVDAVINGTIVGDLHVENFLELQASARVSGTIHYQFLQMDVGAAVHGRLIRAGQAPLAASDNVVAFEVDKAVNA
ncbi:MAG TPA: polymer-forming cytoskeletal protein [Burkholderiaceae bacterium]|jgi:cytoskeletal protein CcmA (bactofilin family)